MTVAILIIAVYLYIGVGAVVAFADYEPAPWYKAIWWRLRDSVKACLMITAWFAGWALAGLIAIVLLNSMTGGKLALLWLSTQL